MDSRAGDTHMEGELAREVIHATGMHEAEGVPHGFSTQDALAGDGADAAVGKSGCHDAAGFAGDLHRTQLWKREGSKGSVGMSTATKSDVLDI